MSFFKFDSENVGTGGFELVAEGKYEATVVNAVAGKTGAGGDKLTVDFEIRSDVEQNHQGAKIMFNNFTFSHEVSVKIVNSLIKALGFAHGHPFSSPGDMANQFISKNLIITVKHEEYDKILDDGKVEKRKSAKAKYYDESKVNPPQPSGPSFQVSEDDLPF